MHYALVLALLMVMTACSGNSAFMGDHYLTPGRYAGHYKVGKPYKIEGLDYQPKEDFHHDEVGIASWYGPGFHGKRTANGQAYNKRALTAAHRTLPMPCMVRVTNLKNEKSVILMVNDRGPFAKSRIIDVSERAAEILAFKQQGFTKVRVQYLRRETDELLAELGLDRREGAASKRALASNSKFVRGMLPNSPSGPTPHFAEIEHRHSTIAHYHGHPSPQPLHPKTIPIKGQYIQIGAYRQLATAQQVAHRLQSMGSIEIKPLQQQTTTLYRVRLGPISDTHKAKELAETLSKNGQAGAMIVSAGDL
jgi:rare lipoprotein A